MTPKQKVLDFDPACVARKIKIGRTERYYIVDPEYLPAKVTKANIQFYDLGSGTTAAAAWADAARNVADLLNANAHAMPEVYSPAAPAKSSGLLTFYAQLAVATAAAAVIALAQ